jgi:hypothetical protein
VTVLRSGHRRFPAFDLNQDDLKGIAPLRVGKSIAVILADRHQVYDPD